VEWKDTGAPGEGIADAVAEGFYFLVVFRVGILPDGLI